MKNINRIYLFIALGFCSLFTISCVNDLGNYEYEDVAKILPVTISGISDTTIMSGTILKIIPEVKNVDREYVYSWYAIPIEVNGVLRQKTILSETMELNDYVRLVDGRYILYFEVRDVERDIYALKSVLLTVTATEITYGWYVLKDINEETDFDYINRDGVLYPDILLASDNRLKGTAVKMAFQDRRYYHMSDSSGIQMGLQAMHVLSSRDMKTFNGRNLYEVYKEYKDEFYVIPDNCAPQSIEVADEGDLFLLNAGKLHSIYGLTSNSGRFSPPKVGFYTLFKKMFTVTGIGASTMVFDLESCTFYIADSFGERLSTMDDRPNYPSPTNMDATVIDLLPSQRNYTNVRGSVIMKNKNKEEYYIRGINFNGPAYPFTSFDTIPAGYKMPYAESRAVPYAGAFVYFGDANKLFVYRNAAVANRETEIITFPEDETIAYLTNMYASGAYNYLVVLTNNATEWKLYVYNIRALGNPDLEAEPAFVYSGTGHARYVMYRP